MAAYAHPEVLVDTSWVKGSLGDQNVRIVEVDYDPTSNYNLGHIPGSGLIDWRKDINDPVTREHRLEEGLGIALRTPRDHEQAPDRPVWRLQQLVRALPVLGLQVLRRRQRRHAKCRGEK